MAGTHVRSHNTSDQLHWLARAHGDALFWHQVLDSDIEAINLRWALLFLIHSPRNVPFPPVRRLLNHADSRVRSLACTYLSKGKDTASLQQIELLASDPSLRVRVAAKRALGMTGGAMHVHHSPLHRHLVMMRVIVSEDDPANMAAYRQWIEPLGCRVVAAATTADTLAEARRWFPTIILTDNQKGRDNFSGLHMTDELARDPALAEIVIIMASADPIEAAFLWSGGDAFVHKSAWTGGQVRRIVQDYFASWRQ